MTKTEIIQRGNDETDFSRNLLDRRASRAEASGIQKRGKSRVDSDLVGLGDGPSTTTVTQESGSAAGEDAEPGHGM